MKKKKHLSERLPAYGFVLLSMLVYGLAPGSGSLIITSRNIAFSLQDILGFYYIFFDLTPIILLLIGQSFLFKFQFHWSASRWLLASFSGVVSYVVWSMLARYWLPFVDSAAIIALLSSTPVLLTGFFQHLVLRRYVKRSWLWILALLVANTLVVPLYGLSSLFIAPIQSLAAINFFNSAFVGGLQGLFLTVIMIMIVRLSMKDTQTIANEQDNITERVNHLKDNLAHNQEEKVYEYQAQLHQKSSIK